MPTFDHLRRIALACLVVSALGAGARAADDLTDDQAAAYYDSGRTAFKAGHYAEAAIAFTRAYDHFKDKNILWNVGVAHEKAGDLAAARDRFKEFLAHDDVDAQLRSEAADALLRVGGKLAARDAARTHDERIAQYEREREEARTAKNGELIERLGQMIDAEKAADAAERAAANKADPKGDPKADPKGDPKADPKGKDGRGKVDVANVTGPETPPPAGPSHVGSWIAIGAGGAVLVGGVVMFFVGKGKFSEIDDAKAKAGDHPVSSLTRQEALDLKSQGETFETLGAVGIAVGAAAVATGIVLFTLVDGPETDQHTTVGFAPGPGGFDVHFSTTF